MTESATERPSNTPVIHPPTKKPETKAAPAAGDKPIELKDLKASPEGVITLKPKQADAKDDEPLTIAESRLVLGYGGPIAVETAERGLQKAIGGDAIYTLSDGKRYTLAAPLAKALGITLPEPTKEEKEAIEREGNFGLTLAEAEEARKKAEAEDKKSEKARKEATQKVG